MKFFHGTLQQWCSEAQFVEGALWAQPKLVGFVLWILCQNLNLFLEKLFFLKNSFSQKKFRKFLSGNFLKSIDGNAFRNIFNNPFRNPFWFHLRNTVGKSFKKYVWKSKYAQSFYEACTERVLILHGSCTEFSRSIHRACTMRIWSLHKACMEQAVTCMEHAWRLHGGCTEHSRSGHYAWRVLKGGLQCFFLF